MTVLMVKTLSRCLKFSQMALNILIRVMLNKKPVYWFDDSTQKMMWYLITEWKLFLSKNTCNVSNGFDQVHEQNNCQITVHY